MLQAFADIADAWYVILASVGISIVIGFAYLWFMEVICGQIRLGQAAEVFVLCGPEVRQVCDYVRSGTGDNRACRVYFCVL